MEAAPFVHPALGLPQGADDFLELRKVVINENRTDDLGAQVRGGAAQGSVADDLPPASIRGFDLPRVVTAGGADMLDGPPDHRADGFSGVPASLPDGFDLDSEPDFP
jgi:hypothetical protein